MLSQQEGALRAWGAAPRNSRYQSRKYMTETRTRDENVPVPEKTLILLGRPQEGLPLPPSELLVVSDFALIQLL